MQVDRLVGWKAQHVGNMWHVRVARTHQHDPVAEWTVLILSWYRVEPHFRDALLRDRFCCWIPCLRIFVPLKSSEWEPTPQSRRDKSNICSKVGWVKKRLRYDYFKSLPLPIKPVQPCSHDIVVTWWLKWSGWQSLCRLDSGWLFGRLKFSYLVLLESAWNDDLSMILWKWPLFHEFSTQY